MFDYKQIQSDPHNIEEHERGSLTLEAFESKKQLLNYMSDPLARRNFEDMVGPVGARNTYMALMAKIKKG